MARDKSRGSKAASLILRIATVALSVVSTVTMASATQPADAGSPAAVSKVSYSDYNSFRYSVAANVISAALQAVAVYLTTVHGGRKQEAKAAKSLAELVDTAARRGDNGGREFHGGVGAAASAMVGEGEGERQRSERGVCGVGATTWSSPRCPGVREASS